MLPNGNANKAPPIIKIQHLNANANYKKNLFYCTMFNNNAELVYKLYNTQNEHIEMVVGLSSRLGMWNFFYFIRIFAEITAKYIHKTIINKGEHELI